MADNTLPVGTQDAEHDKQSMQETGLLELYDTIWAIRFQTLRELMALAASTPRQSQSPIARPQSAYLMDPEYFPAREGVAVINVTGALMPRMSFWSWLFGGTSMTMIQDQLRASANRPDIRAVLLKISSPGGTVEMTAETAHLVRELTKSKPVDAYASGNMCSAAYWIGSAARQVIVSPTSDIGSIGVVATHIDRSGLDEQIGVKFTEITSGKYKRILSEHAPLSREGRDYLKAQVDETHALFVEAISSYRGKKVDDLAEVSQGQTFIGQVAVDQGLADAVGFLDDVLSNLQRESHKGSPFVIGRGDVMSKSADQTETPTVETKTPAPVPVDVAAEKQTAVMAERARIKQIRDLAPAGCEKMVDQFIEDGTSAADAAMAFLKEVKTQTATTAKHISEEAPPVIVPTPTQTSSDASTQKLLAQAVAEHNAIVEERNAKILPFRQRA